MRSVPKVNIEWRGVNHTVRCNTHLSHCVLFMWRVLCRNAHSCPHLPPFYFEANLSSLTRSLIDTCVDAAVVWIIVNDFDLFFKNVKIVTPQPPSFSTTFLALNPVSCSDNMALKYDEHVTFCQLLSNNDTCRQDPFCRRRGSG